MSAARGDRVQRQWYAVVILCTTSGEVLSRQDFENKKKQADYARLNKTRNAPKALSSAGKDLSTSPFLNGIVIVFLC